MRISILNLALLSVVASGGAQAAVTVGRRRRISALRTPRR